mgnify:CR=1 FL=1
MTSDRLLRIAVPNKGALAEPAAAMLRAAGYRQRTDPKDLTLIDADHGVEFYYLRPRDIAVYIGRGDLDLGITGRDMLLDSGAQADEVLPLGFAPSTFRFAAPAGSASTLADLDGRTIATSYEGLLQAYLARPADEVKGHSTETGGTLNAGLRLLLDQRRRAATQHRHTHRLGL